METIKKNITTKTLNFIKSYKYKTPIETILGDGIKQLRVLYKPDYFNCDSPNYKKGIGDIIVIFESDYRVVIKNIISGTWCFALLKGPYNVIEEEWHISTEQEKIIPTLLLALEDGFPHRNSFSNLNFDFKEK